MVAPVNTSSTPVSSRIIQNAGDAAQRNVVPSQTDPSLVTPEDVNRRVSETEASVSAAQQSREQQQTEARTNALNTAANQSRQDLFDQFLAQSTDAETSSNTSGVSLSRGDLQSFSEQARAASLESFDDVLARQRELQQRFDDVGVPAREPVFTIQV